MKVISPKEINLQKCKKYMKLKAKLIKAINNALHEEFTGEPVSFRYKYFFEEVFNQTVPEPIADQVLEVFATEWKVERPESDKNVVVFSRKDSYSDSESINDITGVHSSNRFVLMPQRSLTATIFIWIIRIICLVCVVGAARNLLGYKSFMSGPLHPTAVPMPQVERKPDPKASVIVNQYNGYTTAEAADLAARYSIME